MHPLYLLLIALNARTFAKSYIPPGEDGVSCAAVLCSSGTVCVQTSTGARCIATDPENNCEQKNCSPGTTCEYSEKECIPDKACYAEPQCKIQGPRTAPQEQTVSMVANTFATGSQGVFPQSCGRNEVVNGCGALCEGKCENLNRGPVACPLICLPPACACAEGFYRDSNNNCVSASQCTRQCSANETYNSCGNLCEGTCDRVGQGPRPCPRICAPPACACREGFYRNANGSCVRGNDCPLRCSANETLSSCGNLCEGKCENLGRGPIPCILICAPPACACREGFYRDANGRCVNANSCPSRCGENEVLNQCGNRCEATCARRVR
ncbi:hypothetical protein GCK32_002509 [Trichostrongylus colubriformis]|uniref:TIL domain-containing protein n=1 Tax=Trichostrongylus colubriformis TaxID=6319 RepID=A0AAN8FP92_TRICO